MSKGNVLFLRSGTDDAYTEAAVRAGWKAHTISPIVKCFINEQALVDELTHVETRYCGIIMTSATTAEAIVRATAATTVAAAAAIPCFVVGAATARAARTAGYGDPIGCETGDAQRLAPVITEYFAEQTGEQHKLVKLFHPGASKMIGGLAELLAAHNISTRHLPVYETTSRSTDDLDQELKRLQSLRVDAVVYFSPSGVKAAQHLVRSRWPGAREVAIGSTTARALDSCLIAQHPTAEGVMTCLDQISKSDDSNLPA